MRLNSKKSEEMLVNFMHNHNFSLRSIVISCNMVERVITYKRLGLIISDDLRWVPHIKYISGKAYKRLYSLRTLKRVGIASDSSLRMNLTTIQPILEYGVQV